MWRGLLQVLSSKCEDEVFSRLKDMKSYTRKKVRAYVVMTRTRHMFVIIKTNTARDPYKVFNISFAVEFHKKLSLKAIRRFTYLFTPYTFGIVDCKEDLDYVISKINKQSGMYKYHLSSGIIQSYAVKV